MPRSASCALLALVLASGMLAGCGQPPYMAGYQAGHQRARQDVENQQLTGEEQPGQWDNEGKASCPYVRGSADHDAYKEGYVEGYADGLVNTFNPQPPKPSR